MADVLRSGPFDAVIASTEMMAEYALIAANAGDTARSWKNTTP